MKEAWPAHWGMVGFRLPGHTTQWWSGPVVADAEGPGFVIAPFDTSQPVYLLQPEEQSTVPPQQWPHLPPQGAVEEDSAARYRHKVAQGIAQLNPSTLEKVVLSRSKTINASIQPLPFFQRLQEAYPQAFTYLLWTPMHGCWAGATPETLLAYRDGCWTTQALAGTLPFPATRKWHDKEYREQQLVTDTIVAALTNAGFSPALGERQSLVAGQVQHLSTAITIADDFAIDRAFALAKHLHPTPAVCGLPREKAQQVIAAIEQRDRQLYTGYLGPVTDAVTTQLFVNLRCCQLWQDAVTLHVGGGIVEGSTPEEEWQETVHKAQTIAQIITKMEEG